MHELDGLYEQNSGGSALRLPGEPGVGRQRGGPGGREAACYSERMLSGYIPIFIFLALAISFPVIALVAAKLIRPSAPSLTKLEAYECGIKAASDSRGRYTVRFYIVAILFVIFDVETIFLFPWAVRYRALGWFGVSEIAVFLAILIVGYIWAYKKGALEWV
jgi:NADH-quinone oxidoreductase subunit A